MKFSLIIAFLLLTLMQLVAQESEEDRNISIGEIIEIDSKILGETREIYIHQPQGFWGMDEQMTNLPVVFVLDAESQFLNTVSTVDYLSSAPNGNDLIPRSIVIGIPNTNRSRDLTPVKGIIANDSSSLEITGGGKKFLDFITDELIPFIDSKYSSSQHRTIIGHSLGGLIAFEALLRKREYFNNYVSIDPVLGFADGAFFKEVLDTITHTDLSKENFFFSTANNRPTFLKEENLMTDGSDFMQMCDIPNKKFINHIENGQQQLNVAVKYYPDEHHFSVPYRSTYDAMRFFYHFYPFPEIVNYYHPDFIDRKDLIVRIKEHYEMISSRMGYEMIPMVGYINSFAFGIAPSGREDLAIALFEYNIELHPSNPIVYNNLGYYYMSTGKREKAIELYKRSLKLESDDAVLETIRELENEMSDIERR